MLTVNDKQLKYKFKVKDETYNIIILKVRYTGDPRDIVDRYFDRKDLIVQLIPESLPCTPRHLAIAVYNAMRAHVQGRNVSKTPNLEVLLYLCGTRQIADALKEVKSRSGEIYYLTICSKDVKVLNEVLKEYKLEILDVKGFSKECGSCKDIKVKELESYLGSYEDKLEKAAITKSTLLNVEI